MIDSSEWLAPAEDAPPGPPTDFLPPAPHTLRVPGPPPGAAPANVSLPGYEILGELGRGGMAVVYKARHMGLNRVVALKVLISGAFAGMVERARLRVEAEAVARLHHPNIVQVYDIGEHAGTAFIAFEYVDGPTVRKWQAGRPVEPKPAARLAADVARGIQHAHDAGIVHRDLKTANVLLANGRSEPAGAPGNDQPSHARSPVPKVTDFGLAKPREGAADLTLSGVACGTPNYMAPEQVNGGGGAAMPAVDVWGIGALLYELLTARPPFTGPDAVSIMQEVVRSEPPPVRQFAPGVPRDLEVIVARCLEKNPARRYSTAAEVAEDLERFLAGRSILARPAGVARRAARWVRRNPVAAILGGVLLAGLVGTSAVAVALVQSADREREARADEARQRQQADAATRAAEQAHNATRAALARVEETLSAARAEKDRAEGNLATARRAVDHVLAVIDRQQSDDPTLYPVFRELLVGVEPFLQQFLDQKAGDRAIRASQADVAIKLGALSAMLGQSREARGYLLRAAALLWPLASEYPEEPGYRRLLGHSRASAGSLSVGLGEPDGHELLATGTADLERFVAEFPLDPAGWESLVRARIDASALAGPFDDECHLAVLEPLDRLEALTGPTAFTVRTRGHALNNIAGGMTNRGKTEEAEAYWLQVLRLRESQARAAPADRVAQYELGKCLSNYANQLGRTGRGDQELATRERAAGVFDRQRDDTRFRHAYLDAMVQNDQNLAAVHARRGNPAGAIDRLNRAIDLSAQQLSRNPCPPVQGQHANLFTRRAELLDSSGRCGDAARDFREAARLSTSPAHGEYCAARLFCSLVKSGARAEAWEHASKLDLASFAHPYPCVEVARGWVLMSKAAADDPTLAPPAREKAAAAALARARAAIEQARGKGMFASPEEIKWFRAEKDFEPIRDFFGEEKR